VSEQKPRLLDLFCGAGGCAMGYSRAGFDVVGVDLAAQKNYPFEFHQGDALEYLAAHGAEFDVIHASPPCQKFSNVTPKANRDDHPNLIDPTRDLLFQIGRPFIIENVGGAHAELINPVMLCGTMFGLKTRRHRLFELNPWLLLDVPKCNHDLECLLVTTAGANSRKNGKRKTIKNAMAAYGIDWMNHKELSQAIPPAYTEYLGRQLLAYLAQRKATT
jgi:DNA (cytosine-5)-methyltransferase 1